MIKSARSRFAVVAVVMTGSALGGCATTTLGPYGARVDSVNTPLFSISTTGTDPHRLEADVSDDMKQHPDPRISKLGRLAQENMTGNAKIIVNFRKKYKRSKKSVGAAAPAQPIGRP